MSSMSGLYSLLNNSYVTALGTNVPVLFKKALTLSSYSVYHFRVILDIEINKAFKISNHKFFIMNPRCSNDPQSKFA